MKSRAHAAAAGLSVKYVGPSSGDKSLWAKPHLHVIFVKNCCIPQTGGPKRILSYESTRWEAAAFPHSQVQPYRYNRPWICTDRKGGSTFSGFHIKINGSHRA